MNENSFLLYGANGYTGELIARHAGALGLRPILAGRSKKSIEALGKRLGLPTMVFDLDEGEREPETETERERGGKLVAALREVKVVINAAGPFQFTASQMIKACITTGTHYLDINGDLSVFEMIRQFDAAAKKAGIMLLPGAGFDVVPTDCLALFLKNRLPDATSLQLAFATIGGGLSHGTATTMVSKLGEGGAERRNGKIVRVPLGQKGMWVDFGEKKLFVMSIPWGDVATAYYTTGIPNITSYTGMKKNIYRMLKLQGGFNWILRRSWVRNFLKKKIDAKAPGPDDAQRAASKSLAWGQAKNDAGQTCTATLSGADGYTMTMQACLHIVQKILNGNFKPGFQTPGLAYGEDLVMELSGVKRNLIN